MAGTHEAVFAMGCFWGVERLTGHAEVVRVIYDPGKIDYQDLLKVFWESHDPTQGMRQHGDVGTQYRSAIYVLDSAQHAAAEESRRAYQERPTAAHRGPSHPG